MPALFHDGKAPSRYKVLSANSQLPITDLGSPHHKGFRARVSSKNMNAS